MSASSHDSKDGIRTPIHIYVLWHPSFAQGEELAGDIYRWFRLDTIEGIPVFFRSTHAKPDPVKPDEAPGGRPMPIDCKADINYVIPLVDAHMVADPSWREWLVALWRSSNEGLGSRGPRQLLFPVALDAYAFQVPTELRRLNFIRHDITRQPAPAVDVLLSVLTEVMCRDLRYRLHAMRAEVAAARAGEVVDGEGKDATQAVPSKIRIFLSHAKADGTEVVRRLKEYIQSQTQCETFFDETDIPSGRDYLKVLEDAIRNDAAGMIVIHGTQYAERPWCRREIRTFQQPHEETLHAADRARAFFIPPVVVVENMNGDRVSRSIPELGFAPAMRWSEGSERRIVNTLLREVLLGFFHRMLIRNAAGHGKLRPGDLLVNRPPDPLLVQRLVQEARNAADEMGGDQSRQSPMPGPCRVFYPGYGLSQMEKAVLTVAFRGMDFRPLAELDGEPPSLEHLAGEVVRLSVGDASDILDGGYGDQHNQELVIRLFRPLAKAGASILYGGMMPKAASALSAWEIRPDTRKRFVNFTSTCVHLLISERDHHGDGVDRGHDKKSGDPGVEKPASEARLYNLAAWTGPHRVTSETIAQWVDVCTFKEVLPEDLGSGPSCLSPRAKPNPTCLERSDYDTAAEFRAAKDKDDKEAREVEQHNEVIKVLCLTRMRRDSCGKLSFTNLHPRPGDARTKEVIPIAHVFLGGKLRDWSGIAPGIFEEFAAAFEARQPIFLIGAGQGAAGAIARWLIQAVQHGRRVRPPEFEVQECGRHARNQGLAKLLEEWKGKGLLPTGQWDLAGILDAIEKAVNAACVGGAGESNGGVSAVLRNGLSHAENLMLLRAETGHGEICRLIHQGLNHLAVQQGKGSATKP